MRWEIDLARKYARKGHSITFTAQFIGVGHTRLRRMIDEEGADIQFVEGRQSLAFREGLKKAAESRRGKPVTNPAILAGLALGRRTMRERWLRAAFGVTGTQAELHKHFECPVSLSALRWRTRHGMSTEDALRLPRQTPPKGIIPPQFIEQVKKLRRRAAARVHDRAQRLLTPTMSQYQSPGHEIVVTAQDGTCITVEVRDQTRDALHQLRFVKSFESGVLFVFDPEAQGRIQFIAFEPDSPAIIRSGK
ncbi:hypothetical protein CDEN61S_03200 [Castellaniella denitrificans]